MLDATYRWTGDNIGLGSGDVLVTLESSNGQLLTATIEQLLSVADHMDAYGLERIASALDFCSKHGDLSPCDAIAWRAHRSRVLALGKAGKKTRRLTKRARNFQQTPIASPRYCVMYLKERKEHKTAWFYRHAHAVRALEIMQDRYGEKNAIIFMD